MIVSPPFLPSRNDTDTEELWLSRAMPMDLQDAEQPKGLFPVSRNLGWHGGLHLVAPTTNNTALPVRAIADGQVVYFRKPSAETDVADEPLNYNPGGETAARTDDGCVVIKHETDIGASAAGTATTLTFYSVYMHLGKLSCTTEKVNDKEQDKKVPFSIYRKDELGMAGKIYGETGRIHFEIVFDDSALQRILGRTAEQFELQADAHGRTDVLFGEIYFRLPAGTKFYEAEPEKDKATPTPEAVHTLAEERIVGMRFASGDGAVGNRGDITYTTYKPDGTEDGTALVESAGEYGLYATAKAISAVYTTAGEATKCAVMELLRYGRVIDMDNITLTPANVPIWKKVNYPDGSGWVNLHADNVHVYSDADFPQWRGWGIADDDTDGDSRCNAKIIRTLLDQDADGTITPAEASSKLKDADVRKKVAHFLSKHPSEWDTDKLDSRWNWLKTTSAENPSPMDEGQYNSFQAHAQALCFWDEKAIGISATHWHVHPIEFIKQFRKCCWLSKKEFAQCIPRKNVHLSGEEWKSQSIATWAQAETRAGTWSFEINWAARKYLISGSLQRWAHFLAQLTEECGYYQYVKEGSGDKKDYAPYYGRGLIQLTHEGNYKIYGQYRGFKTLQPSDSEKFKAIGWDPDSLVASSNSTYNAHNCADSAGMYWVSMTAIGVNALKTSDQGISIDDVVNASKSTNGNVVNKEINGLATRLQTFTYLKHVLLDSIKMEETESITFSWRRNSEKEKTGKKKKVMQDDPENPGKKKEIEEEIKAFFAGTHTIKVPLEMQRP